MSLEIRVPALGESIQEATVGAWFKKVGEQVDADEPLVELETDKVTVEVPSPAAGVLIRHQVREGDTVDIGGVLGVLETGASSSKINESKLPDSDMKTRVPDEGHTPGPAEYVPSPPPSVRRIAQEVGGDINSIAGTGVRGQVTKADALVAVRKNEPVERAAEEVGAEPVISDGKTLSSREPVTTTRSADTGFVPPEIESAVRRVPMSRLRQTIARRLKDAQNTAATLTTFNDMDMSEVMALRSQYRDAFSAQHGVRLGFMSFFVRASVAALREFPIANAQVDGTDIVYQNEINIGVAVGSPKGLVVPVLRHADQLSFAEIELAIAEFGDRAKKQSLTMGDLLGGTFTISNGGVFGSMLSTPILNSPQSAVLGLHKIEERPVVRNGEVVIRPMMYVALSYDHRIIDGREAVSFLVRIKQAIEEPARLMLAL